MSDDLLSVIILRVFAEILRIDFSRLQENMEFMLSSNSIF